VYSYCWVSKCLSRLPTCFASSLYVPGVCVLQSQHAQDLEICFLLLDTLVTCPPCTSVDQLVPVAVAYPRCLDTRSCITGIVAHDLCFVNMIFTSGII